MHSTLRAPCIAMSEFLVLEQWLDEEEGTIMMTTIQLRQRQPVSQSASQPVSQSASQPVSQSASRAGATSQPCTLQASLPKPQQPQSWTTPTHQASAPAHTHHIHFLTQQPQPSNPASPQPPSPPTIRQPRTTSNTHCLAQQPPWATH